MKNCVWTLNIQLHFDARPIATLLEKNSFHLHFHSLWILLFRIHHMLPTNVVHCLMKKKKNFAMEDLWWKNIAEMRRMQFIDFFKEKQKYFFLWKNLGMRLKMEHTFNLWKIIREEQRTLWKLKLTLRAHEMWNPATSHYPLIYLIP